MALIDFGNGIDAPAIAPGLEPCPPHLRRLSLVVSANGDAGMKLGAGAGVDEAISPLEDIVPENLYWDYIASANARNLRSFKPALVKHDGHMVIVGSGPSVADHIDEIRRERELGRPIMAIKGAHDWLIDRGITPDLWVSMDSQVILKHIQKKSKETCYLVAGKAHPEIFDWLSDQQVVLWNAWMGQGEEKLFAPESCMVGGGTTSGLRGITLAWLMGFRRVILYGFDSCLKDGAKRVDGSKPIDWTIPIRVGVEGKERLCDSSMASQANEFQALTFDAMPDIKVKVVGDGLLADIMAERQRLGFIDW
jgi:uncharacterized Rossmann fold enzyme